MDVLGYADGTWLIAALVLATVLDDARQPADDGRSIR